MAPKMYTVVGGERKKPTLKSRRGLKHLNSCNDKAWSARKYETSLLWIYGYEYELLPQPLHAAMK